MVCYARQVINTEWDRMQDGTLGEDINPWGAAMFATLQGIELGSPVEEAGYGKWLDQTSDRELARQDRIHGASGVMPMPLWIALFFISAIVLVYVCGFADPGERAWVQAMYMGSVVSVIVTMLLLLQFLDDPFHTGLGGLQPVAMERTELLIEQQLAAIGTDVVIPCDEAGARAERAITIGFGDVTATATVATPPAPDSRRRDWVEILATVLLACAAVATAWSSYQATRWNGEVTKMSGRVNAARIEAARAQGLAEGQTQVDIAMFFEWVNATGNDDAELAAFYDDRFRPEFRPAFDAWLAADPLTDPTAPPTPFAMDEYELQAAADADALDAEAERLAASVRRNVQRAANYVLAVVLFAVALFFGGMSTKLRRTGTRKVLIAVGAAVFVGTASWIATFPVSLAV